MNQVNNNINWKKPDWKDTEFTKFVRLKPDKHETLKKIKDKKSIAGKLDEIIQYYLDKHNLNF